MSAAASGRSIRNRYHVPALQVEGQSVAVRIGCHFGPVVLESKDVFGATVHTANRMTSQAKSGQIMTTAATVERLSPEWRASVRQIDVALLKGQGAEVTLYEAIWHSEDVTSMLPSIAMGAGGDRKAQRLRLQWASMADREWWRDALNRECAAFRTGWTLQDDGLLAAATA